MIKVENIEVFNIEGALRGMRNPLESWHKSDSFKCPSNCKRKGFDCTNCIPSDVGEEDMKLALKLIKAGSDHSKFMRQILVSMDIIAPDYWWKEFSTYKIGTVENSTSTMHKLTSKLLTYEDFSFDEWGIHEEKIIDFINFLIVQWNDKKNEEIWRRIIQNLPMSFNYLRTCTMNYQVLRNMHHNRRNHKLQEWRDFCKTIEQLPYSKLITVKGDKL
jgi:hypothetical protein